MSLINKKTTAFFSILCIFILLIHTQGIARIVNVAVGSSLAFRTALNNAAPGDSIMLGGGNYLGSFYTEKNGTQSAPIWIIGTNNSVLRDAPSDPNLNILHDYYRIEDLTFENGRRAIYAEGASHGIVRNCVGKYSYKGTFKVQQQSKYWLFENCTAVGPQSVWPGEGFYVGKANSGWTGGPDDSGYVTFLNCLAFNCVDDAFDFKESSHHIKVINCVADFNGETITGDNSKCGIFTRTDNLQVYNFLVKNNPQNDKPGEEAFGVYAETKEVGGTDYGSNIELWGIHAENIYEPMFWFNSINSVTLYDNYTMENTGGWYEPGSSSPAIADPSTFVEMTWVGEGGDAYANIAISIMTFPHESGTPKSFSLDQNYPNPFNPATTFSFRIPSTSFVSLKIFDLLGREVTTLVSDLMLTGRHNVTWNAGDLPSGIYVYQLRMGGSVATKKCILVK
jgi:hypothetical protein